MASSDFAQALFAATAGDLREAAACMAVDAVRTPLLPFPVGNGRSIRLKCENLQPLGTFKIRSGACAVARLETGDAKRVATASAGNFAQGLTLAARRRGLSVTVHAPDTAADVKLAAMRELGACVVRHPATRHSLPRGIPKMKLFQAAGVISKTPQARSAQAKRKQEP